MYQNLKKTKKAKTNSKALANFSVAFAKAFELVLAFSGFSSFLPNCHSFRIIVILSELLRI